MVTIAKDHHLGLGFVLVTVVLFHAHFWLKNPCTFKWRQYVVICDNPLQWLTIVMAHHNHVVISVKPAQCTRTLPNIGHSREFHTIQPVWNLKHNHQLSQLSISQPRMKPFCWNLTDEIVCNSVYLKTIKLPMPITVVYFILENYSFRLSASVEQFFLTRYQ